MTTPVYEQRISTRAKRLSITVHPQQRVVITIPHRFASRHRLIQHFITKHTAWIERHALRSKHVPALSYPFTSGKRSYEKYKGYARKKITHRVAELHRELNFPLSYNRISIRNQKTRWGSCSEKKNLNFNYKLAFLPQKIMDYIIIHELCHVRHMHHRKSYWDFVASFCPEYKEIERELRTRFKL